MKKPKNYKLEATKVALVIFYSAVYAIGLYVFMSQADLITTGLAGISQIIEEVTYRQFDITVSYGTIYILLNIPGIILAFKYLGKKFTMYSIFHIITVTLITYLLSYVALPITWQFDNFINSVFGGVLMGIAIGKLLKLGASSGGTDFLGMYLLKYKNIDFHQVNWMLNIIIVMVGIAVFGINKGLYTIISLYVRNTAIGRTFTNPQAVTLFIIGENLEEVSSFINEKIHRGTTIIKSVEGGYTHSEKEIIMTTLNKYEYSIFINSVFDINPNLFINMVQTDQIVGNYMKTKGEAD